MSQTTKTSSYLTAHRSALLVLCWPAGTVPVVEEVTVWEAQQCTDAGAKGTHQWVSFSLGSHCLLSTGPTGEQHNGVAGPLRLILMSYYSSPHYPYYWLVWSQPGALGSNNKQSSFFSSLFFTVSSHWLPRTSREMEPILSLSLFFFFVFSLLPESPAPPFMVLSIRAASMLPRFWSPEVHNHTEWVEAFHPSWLNWFCSKAIIKTTRFGVHKAAAFTALWSIYWEPSQPLNTSLVFIYAIILLHKSICIVSACVRCDDKLLQRCCFVQKTLKMLSHHANS